LAGAAAGQHPQPALPAAFCASCNAQQADASVTAGPPQQPLQQPLQQPPQQPDVPASIAVGVPNGIEGVDMAISCAPVKTGKVL
jgi:hypothetical protein